MADNPKSLASLADDLDEFALDMERTILDHRLRFANYIEGDRSVAIVEYQLNKRNLGEESCLLRAAAAALRAPTIAPQIFTECKGIEELIAPLFDVRAELVRRLGRIGEILFESGFQAESPIESPLGKKR